MVCVGVYSDSIALQVADERTAKNRVFFVSAKEVLQVRTQGQQIPEGKGMPDGWKARLMEFERSFTSFYIFPSFSPGCYTLLYLTIEYF